MILYRGTCETKSDVFGNKPKTTMFWWKRINLGIVKIWLGYEIFDLLDEQTKTFIKDKNGRTISGEHLSIVEIIPFWQKK